jgi:hypothetical protein
VAEESSIPIPPEFIREAIGRALGGGHFFVASARRLRVEHVASEQAVFEIFRGHLLDAAHSRRVEKFETWNVFVDEASNAAEAPLISIRWQQVPERVFIVRRILTHGFEAYEDSPGVILSREVQKWVAELAGTIALGAVDKDELEFELARYVYLAVIGTSRLPITSLESPLPAFSLGEMAYLPGLAGADCVCSDPTEFLRAALRSPVSTFELAKALELALRATPAKSLSENCLGEGDSPIFLPDHPTDGARRKIGTVPDSFRIGFKSVAGIARVLREAGLQRPSEIAWRGELFRALFNSAVLSPYTGYVDALVSLLMHLAVHDEARAAEVVDTISYMLRHLCRHLTAFDLSVFHNFGANYPDALFLNVLLAAYLRFIKTHPRLFIAASESSSATDDEEPMRRRALRQACLVRDGYEGHPVPDAPTSMGENARVLPAECVRVPEEQILHAARRSRRLFVNQPLAGLLSEVGRQLLDQSCEDLRHPAELRELGMALFLDRPLGACKEQGEVDRTPLVSYEAFSRQIAARRLAQARAAGWIDDAGYAQSLDVLNGLPLEGRPLSACAVRGRPGVVSLADAAKAAADFRILRTTRGSLDALLSHFDLSDLACAAPDCAEWLENDHHVLLVPHSPADRPSAASSLRFYGCQGALRLELGFEPAPGLGVCYRERGGVELVERLRVLSLGDFNHGVIALDRPVWLRSR